MSQATPVHRASPRAPRGSNPNLSLLWGTYHKHAVVCTFPPNRRLKLRIKIPLMGGRTRTGDLQRCEAEPFRLSREGERLIWEERRGSCQNEQGRTRSLCCILCCVRVRDLWWDESNVDFDINRGSPYNSFCGSAPQAYPKAWTEHVGLMCSRLRFTLLSRFPRMLLSG
jgi:hypothetical protein